MSLYRIGVDVGGTNTDAAILDIHALNQPGRGVLTSHKASTTPDITSGIEAAIAAILKSSAVDQRRVLSVTIGTTHFINALIEADARRLDRVAVVRLCGPFTRQIPPFSGFPVGLHGVLDGGAYYLDGGLEMDGRHIAPLSEEQVRSTARDIMASGVRSVAVVGVFSPLDHDNVYEERCKTMLRDEAPELRVVCSQNIGPTGFVERENATILNAAILRTGHRVKNGFKRAMSRLNLTCPLYLSQNDGTLIDAETAADFPIKTFASGPTNSMSGAAFLAGLDRDGAAKAPVVNGVESKLDGHGLPDIASGGQGDASAEYAVEPQVLVVDIGGTTTDVCALLPSGFPRQAPGFVEVAGVRTAFSIPEVVSIGLGGGSKVVVDPESPQSVLVGPGSVGHELLSQAKVFGGPTLTATDIVVAEGKASLGDASLVKDVAAELREGGRRGINALLETVIDKMKVSTAPVHVLLVGGGSILVTEKIAGVDKCIEPIHQGAANAVGAAIGKISGEVDTVEILEGKDEKAVIAAACRRAIDQAIAKGARPDDVKIVEVNKMPLQYMSQVTIRIQVRAVGTLAIPDDVALFEAPESSDGANGDDDDQDEGEKVSVPNALHPTTKPSLGVDLATYRPDVRGGTWYPSDIDLELISTGCAILGTGGGGPTYYEYLKSLQCLSNNDKGRMRIVSPKSLKDDAIVCLGTWYGSPSVINERIAAGNEIVDAIKAVNRIQHIERFDAVLADEIGGGNGLSALPVGTYFDVPVVDADGMGRAYPTMYHITFSVYGHEMTPAVITDARGNAVVAMGVDSPKRLETICRNAAVELGLTCACGTNPISGDMAKTIAVPNTLSQSWYLGRAVHQARRAKTSYTDAIFDVCAGRVIFTGKIVDVQRHLGGGYTMGAVVLAPFTDAEREAESKAGAQPDKHMMIPFQNEYLYAALCDEAGSQESQQVVATVPELISILGHDGEAIGSQDLRFGLRVNVIALPAHPLWKTKEAMAVGGPAGFGLKMEPVDGSIPFTEPRSVIDEFNV
ncbi:hydantoinase/oxoprolinase, putative [Metarhizium acridum CQMa 102]|uniref:Hydantoinase/oxoprolinase, putative n=1 Tax=Metarhizium acridum (strain CQMa 102) TaxID=655827 RepID=E9EDL1_METAQ|nr:hydantoinase/oxoprolinase, putative [Metarhizium acridum CQMa 102]EFY86007.1 hydantoinase/oxoprolinase, putative [Metarhizium acridum CQMa 102]